MKTQLILCIIFLETALATQEIQICILDNTKSDIFGEINEIKNTCSQDSCMNWFNQRKIDESQTIEEIEDCFQICGLNSKSLVKEFIDTVIINGCIQNQDLQENFEITSEEATPMLRASNKSQQKEQNFISKFISNLWGSTKKNEEESQELQQQQNNDDLYGSWGSWGSWDSEYYYYLGTATFDNEFSAYGSNSGNILKKTTQGFLQDGEGEFGSVIQYEVREDWTAYGSVYVESEGSIALWFDSYAMYYGSIWGSSWPVLYEESDYEVFYDADLVNKTTYDIEEKKQEKEDKIKSKGLKVPEQLKQLDFGSDYEVTEVKESWEWDTSVDSDLNLEATVPFTGYLFGSLF